MPGPTFAEDRLVTANDILGLHTTMRADEAHDRLQQLGFRDFFALGVASGFSASRADKRSTASIDIDVTKDTVEVFTDPNPGASGILAITRETSYATDAEVEKTAFLRVLTDKFGEPSMTDGAGSLMSYYWAAGIGGPGRQDWIQCAAFAGNVANLDLQFRGVVAAFENHPPPRPRCSLYLQARIISVTRTDDENSRKVTYFSMALVNIGNSYDALSRYAESLKNRAVLSQREKELQPPRDKPDL